MRLEITDFNAAAAVLAGSYTREWAGLEAVLRAMPLHLKASDQAGIQGRPIFDPVGTNEHISTALQQLGWSSKMPIPTEFGFLGQDIDYGKSGVIVEVQFSNYPFLLNNTLRSELSSSPGRSSQVTRPARWSS